MKRRKTIFVLFLLIICLCGCNNSSDNVLEEVNIQEINKDAQIFIQNIKDSNGVFLFSPIDNEQYLIVKYSTVLQGDEAKYLSAISSKITDRNLIINIEEMGTNKYADDRLRETRIFKLIDTKVFDKIEIFKNGEETNIELVSG